MKNKFLIIIFIVLLILLIVIGTLKINKKNSSNKEKTSRNFIVNSNTSSQINSHGENSGIYVGTTEDEKENYLFISIKIDKSISKEKQVSSLISEISTSIGYKIDVNSTSVKGNKIKIDFAKTSAPFELENSYKQTDAQKYFITSVAFVPKTIFDSINKTLKSYFGEETEVYFSADSENINIEGEDLLNISIDKNVAY